MRKRELEEQIFELKLEREVARGMEDQFTEALTKHAEAFDAIDQRLRTLEAHLLQGNSSPNMARRSPDSVVVHPPRKGG